MALDLHRIILCDAEKWLRLVEGCPYQSQWRGVELARTLCKQVGVDISEAVGSGLYPNISAARTMVNEAINSLTQKGTK